MSMPNIWGDPGRLAWGWIGRVRCASRESARRRRGTNDAFVGGVRNCADAAGTDMHAVLRHHMPDVGVRRVHVRHVSGVRPADARQTTAPVASTAVAAASAAAAALRGLRAVRVVAPRGHRGAPVRRRVGRRHQGRVAAAGGARRAVVRRAVREREAVRRVHVQIRRRRAQVLADEHVVARDVGLRLRLRLLQPRRARHVLPRRHAGVRRVRTRRRADVVLPLCAVGVRRVLRAAAAGQQPVGAAALLRGRRAATAAAAASVASRRLLFR